jgi:hypothetical protein
MPRKSKAFLKRAAAARKGWRTRRAEFKKRSEAAKKGHRTRKRNAKKRKQVPSPPPPPSPLKQFGLKYGANDFKFTVDQSGKLVAVQVGKLSYTAAGDVFQFQKLFDNNKKKLVEL